MDSEQYQENGSLIPSRPEREVVAEFVDRYGERRSIRRRKGKGLSVERVRVTPVHALNRAAGVLMGARIRAARERAGLTLEQLCVRAGLIAANPKQRMYEIERGHRQEGVRLGTLYALALALDAPVGDLLPTPEEVQREAGVNFIVEPSLMPMRARA